jgi:MFS family permease
VLYLAVACASALVIVNTVVYVKEYLGGTDSQVAAAFAAAGFGSMLAALAIPRLLQNMPDRPLMLVGGVVMGAGVLVVATGPDLAAMLLVWFVIGLGWSLVQTPAGRVVNRSARSGDRAAYFSAQFALSHAAWLLAYPIAGRLGASIGIEATAIWFGMAILLFVGVAAVMWPSLGARDLAHTHEDTDHQHLHSHGPHHQHAHRGDEGPEPHSHDHRHDGTRHSHPFVIDDHHLHWPKV